MSIGIFCELADGSSVTIKDDCIDLFEAVGFALSLADQLGFVEDSESDRVKSIRVMENGINHLTITVFGRGLIPRPAIRRSAPGQGKHPPEIFRKAMSSFHPADRCNAAAVTSRADWNSIW